MFFLLSILSYRIFGAASPLPGGGKCRPAVRRNRNKREAGGKPAGEIRPGRKLTPILWFRWPP
jgi:hypothetical protein